MIYFIASQNLYIAKHVEMARKCCCTSDVIGPPPPLSARASFSLFLLTESAPKEITSFYITSSAANQSALQL
jgi:hypothetical protein